MQLTRLTAIDKLDLPQRNDLLEFTSQLLAELEVIGRSAVGDKDFQLLLKLSLF